MTATRQHVTLWLEAACELLRARLWLWLWPQGTLARLRTRVIDAAPEHTLTQAALGDDALAAIDRAILSASFRLLGSNRPCLPQALAALRMAERRGSLLRLRFGVLDRQAEQLTAHAWAETADGRVVGSHRALALCSDPLVRTPSIPVSDPAVAATLPADAGQNATLGRTDPWK